MSVGLFTFLGAAPSAGQLTSLRTAASLQGTNTATKDSTEALDEWCTYGLGVPTKWAPTLDALLHRETQKPYDFVGASNIGLREAA